MASKIITKGLKRTALSVALGMCFAGSVYAQSNSAGAISGTTTAGATVVIENPSTGFRREAHRWRRRQLPLRLNLPTGTYKVTAEGKSRDVVVSIGGTANATHLDTVTVVGGAINAIDVASVESTTILTAEQIAKIPVPRNITSVALLAPGTVKGDAAFGNLASFGGASVCREPVLRQRLQHHQLVQEPRLRPGSVRSASPSSRSRPAATAPSSVVRPAA